MAREMTQQEAEGILGLTRPYSYEDAHEAYREAVKSSHPDTVGNSGKDAADRKTIEINAAWSVIKREFSGKPKGYTFKGRYAQASTPSYTRTEFWENIRVEPTTDSTSDGTSGWSSPEPAYAESSDDESTYAYGDSLLPTWARIAKRILGLPLWRLGFFALAALVYWMCFGDSIFSISTIDATGREEMYFWCWGLIIVATLNVFTGHITAAAHESCLWAVDKICGVAPIEGGNLLQQVFMHLPYRLIFIGFATWWYWHFATFEVEGSGALDWPLRVLVFFAAGINFVYPFITDAIRGIFVGASRF